MAKDDKVRQELGTARVRDGCVLYFGSDGGSWISRDLVTGILTIHFGDGTELTSATAVTGLPDPSQNTDPYVLNQPFWDSEDGTWTLRLSQGP